MQGSPGSLRAGTILDSRLQGPHPLACMHSSQVEAG